jgi:hypothetical protein
MLYNSIGFIASVQYARHEWRGTIRKKLAEDIGKESLMVFNFNKKDFNIKTKEFQLNGKWYDVVRVEERENAYIIYAYDDVTETQLTAQYHDILIKNNTKDNDFQSKTQHAFNYVIKEFLFDHPLKKDTPSVGTVFSRKIYHFQFFISNPNSDFDYPPPKGILI